MTGMFLIGVGATMLAFVAAFYEMLSMIKRKELKILPLLVIISVMLITASTVPPTMEKTPEENFNEGKVQGYHQGFAEGYEAGSKQGLEEGKELAFEWGYQKAVRDAELVEVTDTGYIIAFGDNIYNYK